MDKETAMNILKALYDKSLYSERTALETLIPELKEIEDERIRKAIIGTLPKYGYLPQTTIKAEDALTWLEKQGVQKPFDYEHATITQKDFAPKQEPKEIEDEIEIPFGAKDSELQEVTYYIPKGFHAEIDDDKVVFKKGEKSIAWSEEDEKMFDFCCDYLDEYQIEFLERLKARVQGKED